MPIRPHEYRSCLLAIETRDTHHLLAAYGCEHDAFAQAAQYAVSCPGLGLLRGDG